MKKITVLGSTGSVGVNTLKVVKKFSDKFQVKAICAKNNIDLLERQAKEFSVDLIAVYDEKKAKELKKRVSCKVVSGEKGIIEAATYDVDFVMAAMSGMCGLLPVMEAIKAKKVIGLANKEILVSCGEIIMNLKKEHNGCIIPVDSEHNAIFQCLVKEKIETVKKIILTASGGPFRNFSKKELHKITVDMALKHPTYSMGPKISVDSATLMNKGLEVIEAFWLFSLPLDKIEVVIHPTSYVHSFVEFVDSSVLCQMNVPDMRLPIQYALFYPERMESDVKKIDFLKKIQLEFYPPKKYFKGLFLAKEAIKIGKSMPCYLNGANEVLVDRFLKKDIGFLDIMEKLEKLLSSHKTKDMLCLQTVLEIDKKAREDAKKI